MKAMPLSRDEVLDGALALLEEVGLDALTMRRLAQALGVQAGAIYWHFANKQTLIDAMADSLLAGMLDPPFTGTWEQQLGDLSRRMAAAFLRRRDAAKVSTLALRPGPNGLAMGEEMLRILGRATTNKRAALWAASVVGYYVLGYVTDYGATEAAKQRGLRAVVRSFRKELDEERYPELAKVSQATLDAMLTARDAKARFEFGLEIVLRGLRATIPPRPRRRRRPPVR